MLGTYTVAKFNQDNALSRAYPNSAMDAELYSDRQAHMGICYAISLSWLRRVVYFRGEEAFERISYIDSDQNIVNSIQAQIYYCSYFDGVVDGCARSISRHSNSPQINAHDYLSRMINIFDFKKYNWVLRRRVSTDFFRLIFGSYNLEECARAVTSRITAPNTHHIVSFDFELSAHAMACSMSNGTLLFFDPNVGEAHVPASDVQKFVGAILSRHNAMCKLVAIRVNRIT